MIHISTSQLFLKSSNKLEECCLEKTLDSSQRPFNPSPGLSFKFCVDISQKFVSVFIRYVVIIPSSLPQGTGLKYLQIFPILEFLNFYKIES